MKRLLALLVACGSSTPTATVVSIAAPSVTASTMIAPPPHEDICKRVMQQQQTLVASEIDKADLEGTTREIVMQPFVDRRLASCHAFEGGAWAFELQSVVALYGSISGEGKLVLYVHNTRIVAGDDGSMHAGAAGGYVDVDAMLASDYDGDGIPEFYLGSYEDGVEGGHTEGGAIYTFKDGAIAQYAPAEALKTFFGKPRDVDGDGRRDLPTLHVALFKETACGYPADWAPAKFLAHALANGTFSVDDAVAKKFALAWCPAAPAKLEHAEDALCARLWAHTPAEIAAARKRVASCVAWDCDADLKQLPQPPHADEECKPRIDAFDTPPPFTLP